MKPSCDPQRQSPSPLRLQVTEEERVLVVPQLESGVALVLFLEEGLDLETLSLLAGRTDLDPVVRAGLASVVSQSACRHPPLPTNIGDQPCAVPLGVAELAARPDKECERCLVARSEPIHFFGHRHHGGSVGLFQRHGEA